MISSLQVKQIHSYLKIAKAATSLSKDKTKIGCVAIDKDRRIVGVGINGYPPGYNDDDRQNKLDKSIHAEINTLLNSKTYRGEIHAVFIYGLPPCNECIKFLAAYGVKFIYYAVNNCIDSAEDWEAHFKEYFYNLHATHIIAINMSNSFHKSLYEENNYVDSKNL